MHTAPKCRLCGCDELNACPTAEGPCHWVSEDLCSACSDRMIEHAASTTIAGEILLERMRQTTGEGFTCAHDDAYPGGVLVRAAVSYAAHASVALSLRQAMARNPKSAAAYREGKVPGTWPWAGDWWKPVDPRRDLVKAAALIVAEIEKLDRATAAEQVSA